MQFPKFFDAAPRITVRDPLARFLGAVEDGVIEYRYADAVMLAGHSCPTVASASPMTMFDHSGMIEPRRDIAGRTRLIVRARPVPNGRPAC